MAHLQPVIMLDPEFILVLVRLADLLAVCKCSDELRSVAFIVEVAHSILYAVPARRTLRLVIPNLIEADVWTLARGVHGEVQPHFPFQETNFVLCTEPGLLEESWKEDGGVDTVPGQMRISRLPLFVARCNTHI